ncbi:MAG: nucleotidyltransferase domain-containing protein [Rhodocyclaceae bacterium]|jgi:predicted nucleotidyltransferase|nr:nucleotidyltransferase domain-containing protein [Rhodocyclaceae bacterium]
MTPQVHRALDCLAPALPVGSKVFLFGSQAEGRQRNDSDLDLFIVEPSVEDRLAESIRLSSLLGRQLIAADVVVQDRKTFERQRAIPNTLAWHVFLHGIPYGIER